MNYLIETKNLYICNAKKSDISKIMKMEIENNKFVWEGTYEEHVKEIESCDDLLTVFITKTHKKIIGFSLSNINSKSNIFELRRIVISYEERGKGYGEESIKGIMEYAFRKRDINRFWLDVYPHNKIGINLYEKLGMTLEGTLRESYKGNNGYLDQMVYSILQNEYNEIEKNIAKQIEEINDEL